MSAFDRALDECLDAIWTDGVGIEECLRRYPEHAGQLRAHLLAAATVARAYAASTPSNDFSADARARFLIASGQALNETFAQAAPAQKFAEAARERFLVASGERLAEAYDIEPSPSFFAAARARFLMTGHLMRRERAEARQQRGGFSLRPGLRAVGALAGVLLAFSAFSTYTVASADNSLPGDWQYPIKLKTERVRLALAFGEGAKRDVRLHRAKERAKEIAELAQNGETIGPDELHRLAAQTQPLVDEANSSWRTDDLTKLQDVSDTQKQALELAEAQVDPAAQDELAEAKEVAQTALVKSTTALVEQGPPLVLTPTLKLTSTSEPEASATPSPQATSTVGIVIPDGRTPGAEPTNPPPATATSTATALPPISVGTPVEDALGVSWIRVAVGRMSALMPSQKDGWYIQGVNVADENIPTPTLLHLSNVDATSLVTINTRNGDVYWVIAHDGRFDEVQLRLDVDGEVRVIDRDVVRAAYGELASIPLYILDSVVIAPAVTPTPQPAAP